MATFYTVKNRTITEKTTAEAIKAAGLKKGGDIIFQNRNAAQYAAGPEDQAEAVMIYEAKGDNFIGQRV